ncbi:RNA polymerase sigma-I factor [Haloimpatiens sp. FM7330]|uniref:RNA polymerase sigma-I factor n=1 Tax=Haloimpatiens sp. FM7330 TaxID=3298610 RepID=UPI0036345E2B
MNLNFFSKSHSEKTSDIKNINERDKFIEDNKKFIYDFCCQICNRKLNWNNDDELSIGLIAFNKACSTYNADKGNFFMYAKVLMKNSLIDFFRKSKNTPYLVYNNTDQNINYIDYKNSMKEFDINFDNEKRSEEIALFSKELLKYKINFSTLVENSPKHKDTREKLLNLTIQCLKNEIIMKYVKDKRKLPVKRIVIFTNEKRKFIEKWRKYIIALIIILNSSEYMYIRSYLSIKVGENSEK